MLSVLKGHLYDPKDDCLNANEVRSAAAFLLRGKRIAGAQTVLSSDQAHYSGLHLFTRFAGKSCAYLHAALDTLLEDHFANRPGQKA